MYAILQRLKRKLENEGIAGSSRAVWRKYLEPTLNRAFYPDREREFALETIPSVCIPVLEEQDIANLSDALGALDKTYGVDREIMVRVPHPAALHFDLPPVDHLKVERLPFDDELRLRDCIVNHRHLIVVPKARTDEKKLILGLLDRLHMKPAKTAQELMETQIGSRLPALRGTLRHTQPTYDQIMLRSTSGHYGYLEPLDWALVAELPRKFKTITQTARIQALDVAALGRTRIDRQYFVGQRFGEPYFKGDSLLDVCCDLGGLRKFIGSKTKYVGVDLQGMADYYVDLNKEDLPFEDASFDTVVCFEALEHISSIHQALDKMLRVARHHFVGSLVSESGFTQGRSVTHYGHPVGNAHLPIAPVFDRHHWIFTFADAMDFIYYRARHAGFRIAELDLFFNSGLVEHLKSRRVIEKFAAGDLRYLAKHVTVIGFVLERENH